ncbi:hypothetical protein AAMO2058_000828000 [Amorphochlora amoebiformis]
MKDNAPVAPYLRKICGESWTHLVDPTCKALDFIGIRTIGQLRKNLATDKARISRVLASTGFPLSIHLRIQNLLENKEIEQKTTKKMMLHLRKLSMTFNGVYVDKVEAKSEEAKKGIKKGWKVLAINKKPMHSQREIIEMISSRVAQGIPFGVEFSTSSPPPLPSQPPPRCPSLLHPNPHDLGGLLAWERQSLPS